MLCCDRLTIVMLSEFVYWSISFITESNTWSSGWVIIRPTDVVSRSGGNSLVVSIGPSVKIGNGKAVIRHAQARRRGVTPTSEKVPGTRVVDVIYEFSVGGVC
jgi:hypothetical protein